MSIVPLSSGSNYSITTPVPHRPEWIDLMQPAADLANQIAGTDFVPDALRNKPAAIAACILYGAEIGLGPMQSLAKVDIVKGRPAPRAELARALALAAGHDIWVEESTNTRVKVCGKRRGSQHVMDVTWTLDDAKKAGIAGNQNYAKYPRQMLLARASAELVRAMCPDALGGITVFAEEAADIDDAPTPTIVAAPSESPPGTRKRSRAPKEPAAPVAAVEQQQPTEEDHPPSSVDEPATDGPSEAQTRMVMALFANWGAPEREERLAKTSALLDRDVDSWNNVTHDEASRVISGLQRIIAGEAHFEPTEGGDWSIVIDADELLDGGDAA